MRDVGRSSYYQLESQIGANPCRHVSQSRVSSSRYTQVVGQTSWHYLRTVSKRSTYLRKVQQNFLKSQYDFGGQSDRKIGKITRRISVILKLCNNKPNKSIYSKSFFYGILNLLKTKKYKLKTKTFRAIKCGFCFFVNKN